MVDVWNPDDEAAGTEKPPEILVSTAAVRRKDQVDANASVSLSGKRKVRTLNTKEMIVLWAALGLSGVFACIVALMLLDALRVQTESVVVVLIIFAIVVGCIVGAYQTAINPLIRRSLIRQPLNKNDNDLDVTRLQIDLQQRKDQVKALVNDNQAQRDKAKASDHALRHNRVQVESALKVIDDAIAVVGANGRIELLSDQLCDLIGVSKSHVRGRTFGEVFTLEDAVASSHDSDAPAQEAEPSELMQPAQPAQASYSESLIRACLSSASEIPKHHRVRLHTSSGQRIPVTLSLRAALSHGGDLRGAVALFARTDGVAKAAANLSPKQATEDGGLGNDPATELAPRRRFVQRLEELVRICRKQDTQSALLIVAPDGLFQINKELGFRVGEELLWQLARVLEASAQDQGTVYRIGADHFAVLAPFTDHEGAESLANKLRQQAQAALMQWEGRTLPSTVSIGLVMIERDTPGGEILVEAADKKLVEARERGGNLVVSTRPDGEEKERRQTDRAWVEWLLPRLNDHRMHLISQDIHPIDKTKHSETLTEIFLRIEDDDGVWVSPKAFLPSVRRHNLSSRVDLSVLEKVLKHISGDEEASRNSAYFCLNLSKAAMSEPEYMERATRLLLQHGRNNQTICFEVDEDVAASHPKEFRTFVGTMTAAGAHVGLDRCRVGTSSSTLRDLPLLYVKIHESVVRNAASDPLENAQLRWITESAHALNRLTIASHVESPAMLDAARDAGVDYAQGSGINQMGPMIS